MLIAVVASLKRLFDLRCISAVIMGFVRAAQVSSCTGSCLSGHCQISLKTIQIISANRTEEDGLEGLVHCRRLHKVQAQVTH